MFMMYFTEHVLATTAATFMVMLLLQYKGITVISYVTVTPLQLKIIIILAKII
jgi:hypothetical protein